MLLEPENASGVEPQSLPNRITTLHRRVEGADAGLVPMHEPTRDVDDQVAIALVEALLHALLLRP